MRSPSFIRPLMVGAAGVLAAVVAVVALVPGLDFGVDNPVETVDVDRSSPVIVDAVYDLADLHGSTADMQVIVDIEDDTRFVPAAIRGERVLYQAFGTIDGVVALSALDEDSVTVAEDGTVTVVVPHATYSDVTLDLEESKVIRRDRGLLDRAVGVFEDSPTSEHDLQVAGIRKIRHAARDTELLERAEDNATDTLTRLLEAGGATDVVVEFVDPDPTKG